MHRLARSGLERTVVLAPGCDEKDGDPMKNNGRTGSLSNDREVCSRSRFKSEGARKATYATVIRPVGCSHCELG
jgi:hypothetical protein